jgi:hypothetical protein
MDELSAPLEMRMDYASVYGLRQSKRINQDIRNASGPLICGYFFVAELRCKSGGTGQHQSRGLLVRIRVVEAGWFWLRWRSIHHRRLGRCTLPLLPLRDAGAPAKGGLLAGLGAALATHPARVTPTNTRTPATKSSLLLTDLP